MTIPANSSAPRRRRATALLLGLVLGASLLAAASPVAAHSGGEDRGHAPRALLAAVHRATAPFHRVAAAEAAGYAAFYVCTDEPGQGAMGQHFVNGALAADPEENALTPEAVIYEPDRHGRYHLVAVEYVTFQADWDARHASPPSLFGHEFHLVGSPNRYGLPPFYELHLWIWKHNPSGLFNDWNPRVSCRYA